MIYSFDVFDTCIARTCGKPDNIYRMLAEEVVKYKDESILRAFVIDRKKAEKTAMRSLNKEAVILDEIYDYFDISFFTDDITKNQVKELEIALEVRSFSPITDTLEKLNVLRDKGRILFISDMYLPEHIIRKVLIDYGFMQDLDHLYVSGSVGLSKHSGGLFDYVRIEEGIHDMTWVHYGDNMHSDYYMPKKKGLKAKLICTDCSDYEKLVESEARYFPSSLSASVFAGLMRAARLSGKNKDGGFVANIMSPLLVPFVDALLKDAVARHIQRLYFASRDAYVMYVVAKELLPLYKDIEIRYLHISTKSVYPASIKKADKEEFSHLLKYIGCFSPGKIMQMLDCTDDEMRNMECFFDLDEELHYGSLQSDTFMKKLLEGGNCALLRTRCAAKRKMLMDYLRQEGFCGDNHVLVGLVDVGWRCSTQEMLQEIIDTPVRYYYWGVSHGRVGIGQSGPFTSFFYAEDFQDVYRNNKFIEFYICRSTEGSTLGYERTDAGIVPVLDRRETELMDEEIHRNHELVRFFARQYQQFACLEEYSLALFRSLFLRLMCRFMRYPDKTMTTFLSKKLRWGHFVGKKIPIIIKLYPWTALYIAVFYCLKNRYDYVYKYRQIWLEASLVYTYGMLGKWLIWCKGRLLASRRLRYLGSRLLRNIFRNKH